MFLIRVTISHCARNKGTAFEPDAQRHSDIPRQSTFDQTLKDAQAFKDTQRKDDQTFKDI